MDASEDWTIEGDIGLGKKRVDVNECIRMLLKGSAMPELDVDERCAEQTTSAQEKLERHSKWNESWRSLQRNHSDRTYRNRRAVIRTLSGSWSKSSEHSCSNVRQRRNSCGHVEVSRGEEEQRSAGDQSETTRRHSSLLCCPDALRKLRRKIGNHLAIDDSEESSSDDQRLQQTQEQLAQESLLLLGEANKTIAALQGKLDVYEGLLHGKSKASEVLLKQLLESVQGRVQSEARWSSESREQRLESSRLQFQLLAFQGNLTDTQRAWLERINGVIKENSELQTTVQTQTRIIQKLSSDKTSLKRECDELCSLQDARERIAYQRRESLRVAVEGKEGAAEQALLELAILGSCSCRSKNQEPCLCAKSACRRQQQVGQLRQKVSELEEQKEETGRLMEIYRQTFEEQLDRNRAFTKKVALLERRNEMALKSRSLRTFLLRTDSQSNVVNSLVDLVCDRTDALLQQQVLTKLLSRRLTELERNNQKQTLATQ